MIREHDHVSPRRPEPVNQNCGQMIVRRQINRDPGVHCHSSELGTRRCKLSEAHAVLASGTPLSHRVSKDLSSYIPALFTVIQRRSIDLLGCGSHGSQLNV